MTTRLLVGRSLSGLLLVTATLAGPVGCGEKEIDALRGNVARLEQELTATRGELAEIARQLEEVRAQVEESDTTEKALVERLTRVRVERDKLKQEVAALKRPQR